MITKWYASGLHIDRVECIRETERFVVLPVENWSGSGETRATKKGYYFDSWQEVYDHLVRNATQRLSDAQEELERAQSRLAAVIKLQEEAQ